MKYVFLYPLLILILILQPGIAFSNIHNSNTIFKNLTARLIRDGFTKTRIDRLYAHKDILFDAKGVSLFFIHSEANLDYGQFVSKSALIDAKIYMNEHRYNLDAAEIKYGVDKTIITAIILVETSLGKYLGNRLVINTLSTMAALKNNRVREKFYRSISSEKKFSRSEFEKKAKYKAKWAYIELKALLKYAKRENLDPFKIKGSYAGALGISQFLPSNALSLAADGDNDGSINLFHHPDAIYSIANFLKHYGWDPDIKGQKAYKILYKYNHSKPYVDTLLKISNQLKELSYI